jgi:5'-3' exonuclease
MWHLIALVATGLGRPALAQADRQTLFELILTGAVLIVVLVFGAVFLNYLRKSTLRKESSEQHEAGRLSMLEQLREQGTISHEEFNKARRTALGLPPRAADDEMEEE